MPEANERRPAGTHVVMRRSTSSVAALIAGFLVSRPAAAEEGCAPAVRLHGDSDLTARARAMLSPSIQLLGPDAPRISCPITEAWITLGERGVVLVLESPWGVETRAVQSLELAVALLESWSVEPPRSSTQSAEGTSASAPLILEPVSPEPSLSRHLSIAGHLELSTISGRSFATGAEVSVGPIYFDMLRPFLSIRGARGFGYPRYTGRSTSGVRTELERSSGEFGLLLGLELDVRPARRLALSLSVSGGATWTGVDQSSPLPGPRVGSRSFLDSSLETRAAIGIALDEVWSIELSLRMGLMRDLSRVIIPEPDPSDLDPEIFLLNTRLGVGLRWNLTSPSSPEIAAQLQGSDPSSEDRARIF